MLLHYFGIKEEYKMTHNKYTYLLIFGMIILSLKDMTAQQLANSTHISEARAAWNPAITAVGNDLVADGFFRMQWLGFNGAPVSGFTSLQIPFPEMNMSAGALLNFDKTGPVSKVGAQLNYAYKLKGFLSNYGQLSIGVSGNFQQYSFDGSGQFYKDEGDLLISNSRSSAFFPSIGSGVYYTSNIREYKGNTFFAGVAVNQIYTTKVLINDFDQVRQKHFHLNAGGRFYSFDSYLEPMITANIVNPAIADLLFSLKYEKENTFWAGLGYAGSGMAALQAGIIIDEFGGSYGKLKIGVLGNYGLTSSISKTGPGFEFYIAYLVPRK